MSFFNFQKLGNWQIADTKINTTDNKGINDLIRSGLMTIGDDGTQERQVDHFIFPLIDCVNAIGFKAMKKKLRKYDLIFQPFDLGGMRLTHFSEVASAEFDDLTLELRELCESVGWDYDGWEATGIPKYAVLPAGNTIH